MTNQNELEIVGKPMEKVVSSEINQVSPEIQSQTLEKIDGDKKEEPAKDKNHDKFGNKIEYILSCIGFAVGFGNVWRFPYMVYKMGGAGFLIPYFFCFFFIAVPLFLIETAYG
jgi:uncharacterized membrane protein YjjP (DUF1212 family)